MSGAYEGYESEFQLYTSIKNKPLHIMLIVNTTQASRSFLGFVWILNFVREKNLKS